MPAGPFTLAFPVGVVLIIVGLTLALAFRRRRLGLVVGGLGLFIVAATAAVALLMSLNPM